MGNGSIFGSNSAVFYIITPGRIVVMGTQHTINNEALIYVQF